MPDDEGYTLPGDLPLGAYAGGEMDLGETLRPLAGFGRQLEGLAEEEPGPFAPGFRTRPFNVTFGVFL